MFIIYQNIASKVLTGEVRLSYANLNEPRAQSPGATPKYSASLLIPKTDVATIEDIKKSIEAAAQEAQGKKWNGYRPPNIYSILHDGDSTKDNGKPYGDECKGHWVLNASSNQKPPVVDGNCRPIMDSDNIYSGMRAYVTINFYGYSQPQKIGVGCGLGSIMKTRDDERLGGGASAERDFEGVTAPVSAPGYAPPTQGYAPQTQGYIPPATPGFPVPGYNPTPPMQGSIPPVNLNPFTGLPM